MFTYSYYVLHLMTDQVKGMFSAVDFSESGTMRREREEQAYIYFGDYLDALEGMYMYVHILHDMTLYIISFTLIAQQIDSCTLGEVLIFFFGADYPPPLGFLTKAHLKFLECEKGRGLPTASTCSLTSCQLYTSVSPIFLLPLQED